jgi:hypothetical protein
MSVQTATKPAQMRRTLGQKRDTIIQPPSNVKSKCLLFFFETTPRRRRAMHFAGAFQLCRISVAENSLLRHMTSLIYGLHSLAIHTLTASWKLSFQGSNCEKLYWLQFRADNLLDFSHFIFPLFPIKYYPSFHF